MDTLPQCWCCSAVRTEASINGKVVNAQDEQQCGDKRQWNLKFCKQGHWKKLFGDVKASRCPAEP